VRFFLNLCLPSMPGVSGAHIQGMEGARQARLVVTVALVATGAVIGAATALGTAPGAAPATGTAADAGAPRAPTLRATNERKTIHVVARTPKLEGPEDLEKAPILVLSPEAVKLDGHPMEPKQLERELATLRKNHGVTNPTEFFSGEVVVVCAPETPTERLREPLRETVAAGYPYVLFAFLHEIPGTGWSTGSAVRASIASAGKKAQRGRPLATVTLDSFEDCRSLSQALIEARADQPVVRLELNEKANPTAERRVGGPVR
jgi:hypothetical protein